MFSSEAWLANPSSGFYNGVATQSLRLNTPDDPRLTRTPSSGGNRKTWTFSIWIKRGVITVNQVLFGAFSSGSESNFSYLSLHVDDQIGFDAYGTSYFHTNRLLRDTTGWCNLVFAVDTTQSTSGDRVKLYVNGVQDSSFASGSMPSLNLDTAFNDTCQHTLFANHYSGSYDSEVSGYVSDINFVDGSQLTASSFGEFKNGVWIPKKYTGSYGTNGFRLEFKQTGTGTASTSTIGADTSGNTNHFTSSNLASTDSNLPDCPEDNYPTMNPLHKGTDTITFTEGNLKSSFTSDTDDTHHGCTFALPKEGKWYWEQTFTGADTGGSQAPYCGIYDSDTLALGISDNLFTTSGDFITYYTHNNAIYISGSSTNYTGSIGNQSGAVVGFAVDMDGGHCWVHVNGTYINGTPTFSDGTNKVASPNTDSTYIPFWSGNGGGVMTWEANFGQASFTGTIPTGYSKLTSANLPEPTISPNADTQADDYFDTFLFSGDGNNPRTLAHGLDFTPDWIWQKNRGSSWYHRLVNSVRGYAKDLFSNTTGTEEASNSGGDITAVDATNMTLQGSSHNNDINGSGENFVMWCWKAGGNHADVSGNFIKDGVAFTPTQGTIDASYISVNTTSCFSIVQFTSDISSDVGETGTPPTIAHGIGVKPTLVIVKDTDGGSYPHWNVWHQGYQPDATYLNYQLFLQANSASNNAGWHRTDTGFTTNLFTPPRYQYNETGKTYICFVFAEVEGFSKFGSLTANGSADGSYCYLGFQPSLVIIKQSSASGDWNIIDTTRQGYNHANGLPVIRANSTAVEEQASGNQGQIDILSNGFKFRSNHSSFNTSGASVVYMAWAEIPDKYSNAF